MRALLDQLQLLLFAPHSAAKEKQKARRHAQPSAATPPRVRTPKVSPEMADALAQLNTEFDSLNNQFFDGKLLRPTITFSNRKTFGGYYRKKDHKIVLSWQAYTEHGWAETLNTFRHEVAHIVHQNHRAQYWELAVKLGVVKRYAASPVHVKPRAYSVYIYTCPVCKTAVHRRRKMRKASCARCDKQYNPRFQFKLTDIQRFNSHVNAGR